MASLYTSIVPATSCSESKEKLNLVHLKTARLTWHFMTENSLAFVRSYSLTLFHWVQSFLKARGPGKWPSVRPHLRPVWTLH